LELYRRIYEEYLAVPVIKGTKSEADTFGGAIYTNTVEVHVNIHVWTLICCSNGTNFEGLLKT